jgi:teichuronic acid exporter
LQIIVATKKQPSEDQKPSQDSLRQRTISGIGWRFSGVWVQFISQFGISIILARLLPPEDFGLVALAMIVIGFGQLVTDLGLGPSLIQRKILTAKHISVAFTLSVMSGGLLTILVFITAPILASFLQDARVIPILQLLSLKFLVVGCGIASHALLTRQLHFRQLLIVDFSSHLIGYGLVSIILAVQGFGVWSLVYGSLLQATLATIIAYFFVRHSLRPLLRLTEIKELANFSIGSSLTTIVNYFALQGDYFVVGRLLGPAPLGLYSRAYTLMKLPLTYFVKVLSHVLFPVASQMQDESRRSQRFYLLSLSLTNFVVIPAMIFIIILAPEIILGVFGSQWEGAIIPLQILSVFSIFRATYHVAASFIKAKGQIYQLFWYQLVYGLAVVGGSWLVALRWGINGVALAVGLAIFLMCVLVIAHANRVTGTTWKQFLQIQWPGVVLSLLVAPTTLLARGLYTALDIGLLAVLLCTAVTIFILVIITFYLIPPTMFGNLPVVILTSFISIAPPRVHYFLKPIALRFDKHII